MRAAITDAAWGLYRDGGLEALTMRNISSRLGISAMTPYHYFSDKNELLTDLWQHVLVDVHEAVSNAIASQRGGRARCKALVDAFILFYETHPDEYRLVYQIQHAPQRPEQAGRAEGTAFARLRQALCDAVAAFAEELGVGATPHRRITEDLVVLTMFGYLQATLVNRRYPWSDRGLLRAACIEQIMLTAERCLRDGPR